MIVYYCFLEVFNEELSEWEHVHNHTQFPDDLNYGEFFTETDRESLFFFFQDLENQQEAVLFSNWKGLPTDVSNYVVNQHDFLFNEICLCNAVSCFYLNELTDFDYDRFFNLYKLPKWKYKNYTEYNYVDRQKNKYKEISYKNYLGNTFFEDLNFIKQFERFGKCRIIYFADSGNRWREGLIEPEPYFKVTDQKTFDDNSRAPNVGRINSINYNLLYLFIEKYANLENEEDVENIENLGIKTRDIFLKHLKEKIPLEEYDLSKNCTIQRFKILEKLFAFGYHNGKVNHESIKDYCGDYFNYNDVSSKVSERFLHNTTADDYKVVCGNFWFKSLLEFENFTLTLRVFCYKWKREIQMLSWFFTKIQKTNNYEELLIELEEKLKRI